MLSGERPRSVCSDYPSLLDCAMSKKKDAPIGFGRKPMPDEAGDTEQAAGQPERQVAPPLVEPKAIDDVTMYEIFTRYNLHPLLPPAKFEYQLVEIIAALEDRVRELDPDL